MRFAPHDGEPALETPPDGDAVLRLMASLQALAERFDMPLEAAALGLAETIDRVAAFDEMRERFDVRRAREPPIPRGSR
jgi:hypothetical protein